MARARPGRRLAFAGLIAASVLAAWPLAADAEEIWVPACKGQADISGGLTAEQAYTQALNGARAMAVEQAFGIEVNSAGGMIDFTANNETTEADLRKTMVRTFGLVVGERNIRKRTELVPVPSGDAIPRVSVEGDFKVVRPPKADGSLSLQLRLGKSTLVAGDLLELEVAADSALYLTIFNLAADHRVYILYPNEHRKEVQTVRGKRLRLPEPSDTFALMPRTVPGHRQNAEFISAIGTRDRIAPPVADGAGTISLQAYIDWLAKIPAGDWAEAQAAYVVHAADQDEPQAPLKGQR